MKKNLSEIKNARLLAVLILTKVETEGAYANELLRNHLEGLIDARDRNLVTALVNGVLKNKLTLDYALRRHLSKPMSALPHEVRAVLRTGAFQILYMDKIPVSAAVNESVENVKQIHKGYTALVNGVLHKVADSGWNFQWPEKSKDSVRYLEVRYSHPDWMIKRWLGRWGLAETEALLQADNNPSPTCIRTNTLKVSREDLQRRLEEAGVKVRESSKIPEALFIEDFGAVEKTEAFKEGLFTVQDESSQLIAHVLGPKPGDRVLDTCSAPGGKTTHMAQLMGNIGEITAVDIYPQKLTLVDELAERLGISIISTREGDARFLEGIEGKFNKILVDAPCSGLGVIRRRADLRWQKREDEIAKLPELQLRILLKAADFVEEGGELVYSTCTTEPEENFEVIKQFRRLRPGFNPVDLTDSLPFKAEQEYDLRQLKKGVWQILPHHHQMDGFFLAKFKRACL